MKTIFNTLIFKTAQCFLAFVLLCSSHLNLAACDDFTVTGNDLLCAFDCGESFIGIQLNMEGGEGPYYIEEVVVNGQASPVLIESYGPIGLDTGGIPGPLESYVLVVEDANGCLFEFALTEFDCSPPSEFVDCDNDGLIAMEDCDDNNPAIGATQAAGTVCDDNNPDTSNDVIQEDGCSCQGTLISDECADAGGDADGDGICADFDLNDNDPNVGQEQESFQVIEDIVCDFWNDTYLINFVLIGEQLTQYNIIFDGGSGLPLTTDSDGLLSFNWGPLAMGTPYEILFTEAQTGETQIVSSPGIFCDATPYEFDYWVMPDCDTQFDQYYLTIKIDGVAQGYVVESDINETPYQLFDDDGDGMIEENIGPFPITEALPTVSIFDPEWPEYIVIQEFEEAPCQYDPFLDVQANVQCNEETNEYTLSIDIIDHEDQEYEVQNLISGMNFDVTDPNDDGVLTMQFGTFPITTPYNFTVANPEEGLFTTLADSSVCGYDPALFVDFEILCDPIAETYTLQVIIYDELDQTYEIQNLTDNETITITDQDSDGLIYWNYGPLAYQDPIAVTVLNTEVGLASTCSFHDVNCNQTIDYEYEVVCLDWGVAEVVFTLEGTPGDFFTLTEYHTETVHTGFINNNGIGYVISDQIFFCPEYPVAFELANINTGEIYIIEDPLFYYFECFGPLDVELLSFEGFQAQDKNHLLWQTATEKESAYFSLERSYNGIDFTEITKVQAAGNSTTVQDYQFIDLSFNQNTAVTYYRLSETNTNNQTRTLGDIVSINKSSFNEQLFNERTINLFPNPATETLLIHNIASFEQMSIYDLQGSLIMQSPLAHEQDQISLDINSLSIPEGFYLLSLTGKEGTSTKHFQIVNQ